MKGAHRTPPAILLHDTLNQIQTRTTALVDLPCHFIPSGQPRSFHLFAPDEPSSVKAILQQSSLFPFGQLGPESV